MLNLPKTPLRSQRPKCQQSAQTKNYTKLSLPTLLIKSGTMVYRICSKMQNHGHHVVILHYKGAVNGFALMNLCNKLQAIFKGHSPIRNDGTLNSESLFIRIKLGVNYIDLSFSRYYIGDEENGK